MSDAIVKANEGPQILAMMSQAITALGGANAKDGADAMRVLFDLQREQADRQARREFFEALNTFHRDVPKIPKDHTADQVSKRTGNSRSIPYAPLSTIERIVRPLLIPLGFSWRWDTQQVDGKTMCVTCYLMHVGGHVESASLTLTGDASAPMSETQLAGSTRTYGMRYSLEQVLGLVTTTDTDGADQGGADPIDEDQLATIEHWIAQAGADRAKFLTWIGSRSTSAIPQRDYARAVAALKSRAK